MWIFCCGPVRSGSTLQYNITREIVERSGKGKIIGYIHWDNFPQIFESYTTVSELKVIKTHQLSDEMISLIQADKAKAVYCFRDIRDVIVSSAHKENITIKPHYDYKDLVASYIDYFYKIKSLPNTLISKYEDFYDNINGECKRVLNFLNIKIEPEEVTEIEEVLGFSNNQQSVVREAQDIIIGSNGVKYQYNKKTLLHANHFKHVHPGSHKRFLSTYNISSIEKYGKKWFLENGYNLHGRTDLFSKLKEFLKAR